MDYRPIERGAEANRPRTLHRFAANSNYTRTVCGLATDNCTSIEHDDDAECGACEETT